MVGLNKILVSSSCSARFPPTHTELGRQSNNHSKVNPTNPTNSQTYSVTICALPSPPFYLFRNRSVPQVLFPRKDLISCLSASLVVRHAPQRHKKSLTHLPFLSFWVSNWHCAEHCREAHGTSPKTQWTPPLSYSITMRASTHAANDAPRMRNLTRQVS